MAIEKKNTTVRAKGDEEIPFVVFEEALSLVCSSA